MERLDTPLIRLQSIYYLTAVFLVYLKSRNLKDVNIVILRHLGSLKISIVELISDTAKEITTKNSNSGSIVNKSGQDLQ
jgi:hypothetical protein